MAMIDEILFLPPMAVGRLGGSDVPLDSFNWAEDPTLHGAGLTVIVPAVSLEVLADGALRPFMPSVIRFRDGRLFRPTAPFFELWVRSNTQDQPLTLKWLHDNKVSLSDIQYSVVASNRKAARRSGAPACAFSAEVDVAADDHNPRSLLASSSGDDPLVLPDKPVDLGRFHVLRPTPVTAMGVDLSILRVRFTPARGQVYGPVSATQAIDPDSGRKHEIVPEANRILNQQSSWLQYSSNDRQDSPEPSDTYDGSDDSSRRNRSFGVVDDTCDVVLQASLRIGGRSWRATARVFVAPPDFAPDRRPFCSLAEELADRDPPAIGPKETPQEAMDRLGDLFQRVYETASLANVDMMRNAMMPRDKRGLVSFADLPAVTLGDSMTPKDSPYFDQDQNLNSTPVSHDELPYSSVAAQTHAPLADTEDLALFLRTSAKQVKRIVRPAYPHFKDLQPQVKSSAKPNPKHRDPRVDRDTEHDMRMPPYMRDSDASPLSLNRRQYDFLMQTVDGLQTRTSSKRQMPPSESSRVQDHVSRVVERLSTKTSSPKTSWPNTPSPNTSNKDANKAAKPKGLKSDPAAKGKRVL
jgi:hypothetical protein